MFNLDDLAACNTFVTYLSHERNLKNVQCSTYIQGGNVHEGRVEKKSLGDLGHHDWAVVRVVWS